MFYSCAPCRISCICWNKPSSSCHGACRGATLVLLGVFVTPLGLRKIRNISKCATKKEHGDLQQKDDPLLESLVRSDKMHYFGSRPQVVQWGDHFHASVPLPDARLAIRRTKFLSRGWHLVQSTAALQVHMKLSGLLLSQIAQVYQMSKFMRSALAGSKYPILPYNNSSLHVAKKPITN